MDGAHTRTKKRKSNAAMDAERSLYSNFVTAANSVSALYSQAAKRQQEQWESGAREALV